MTGPPTARRRAVALGAAVLALALLAPLGCGEEEADETAKSGTPVGVDTRTQTGEGERGAGASERALFGAGAEAARAARSGEVTDPERVGGLSAARGEPSPGARPPVSDPDRATPAEAEDAERGGPDAGRDEIAAGEPAREGFAELESGAAQSFEPELGAESPAAPAGTGFAAGSGAREELPPSEDVAALRDARDRGFAEEPSDLDEARDDASALPDSGDPADEILGYTQPEDRIAALAELSEDRARGIRALRTILLRDPHPDVRAEAAEQLALSSSRLAVGALREALADPDPRVVVTVIESMEFAGDRRDVAVLELLLEHPDPEVRLYAREAIDFLQ